MPRRTPFPPHVVHTCAGASIDPRYGGGCGGGGIGGGQEMINDAPHQLQNLDPGAPGPCPCGQTNGGAMDVMALLFPVALAMQLHLCDLEHPTQHVQRARDVQDLPEVNALSDLLNRYPA
jgi:hypothetical protein